MSEAVRDEVNIVIFRYGESGKMADTTVPVLVEDGYRQAWRTVIREYGMAAESVTGIASDWTPTAADESFLRKNFPNLREVSAAFTRPDADGWDQALAAAEQARQEAERQLDQEERHRANRTDREAGSDEPLMIPMLRTAAAPPPLLAHRELVPGQLYVVVAGVAPTPTGSLGMHWVLEKHVQDTDFTFEDVLAEANANLGEGLRTVLRGESARDRVVHFQGIDSRHLPAAALALPGFADRVSGLIGGDSFVAAFPCEDHLYFARADSEASATLADLVREPHDCASDLIPTVLLLDPAGIRILAQFPR
ncbi:hypothetical protein [Nocardia macrotermitis]|uniref:hypothetical protein n=1 Tax=Nocardia macrotermitis TaxID=2585198 RepID=UPI0012980D23|nr:hypothetical protein [Nocardia macrotermitis]